RWEPHAFLGPLACAAQTLGSWSLPFFSSSLAQRGHLCLVETRLQMFRQSAVMFDPPGHVGSRNDLHLYLFRFSCFRPSHPAQHLTPSRSLLPGDSFTGAKDCELARIRSRH